MRWSAEQLRLVLIAGGWLGLMLGGTVHHEVGPLTVTVTRMAHPVPAFAMRLEHGGRSLVYSGDIVLSITGDKIDSGKLVQLAERSLEELYLRVRQR